MHLRPIHVVVYDGPTFREDSSSGQFRT